MKKTLLTLSVLATLGMSTSAIAFEKGDFLLRVGATSVNPSADSSPILAGGLDLGADALTTSVGTSLTVDVNDNATLGLNFAYFITDNINIELLAAAPFKHDVQFVAGDLADTNHLPPSLTANYYFMDGSSKFQPYVGAGINYTFFFNEEFKGPAVTTIEALTTADLGSAATVSNLKLGSSLGITVQAGFDYQVGDNVFVNASVRYIDLESDASFDISGLEALEITSGSIETVDIDPLVWTLSVAYRF